MLRVGRPPPPIPSFLYFEVIYLVPGRFLKWAHLPPIPAIFLCNAAPMQRLRSAYQTNWRAVAQVFLSCLGSRTSEYNAPSAAPGQYFRLTVVRATSHPYVCVVKMIQLRGKLPLYYSPIECYDVYTH